MAKYDLRERGGRENPVALVSRDLCDPLGRGKGAIGFEPRARHATPPMSVWIASCMNGRRRNIRVPREFFHETRRAC
jgi:hypothetical protein